VIGVVGGSRRDAFPRSLADEDVNDFSITMPSPTTSPSPTPTTITST